MALTEYQEREINRIAHKRKQDAFFMAFLDFLSMAATLACVVSDAFSIFGIPLLLTGPIGWGIGLMIGALTIAIIAGVIWGRKKFKGYSECGEKEIELMRSCYGLENTHKELGLAPLNQPEKVEELSVGASIIQGFSKFGNRSMSFLNGFGTMLGMAGVILGAASITLAAGMPPLFLGIFIVVGALAVAFAIASVISEYYIARQQEEHIEDLRSRKEQLLVAGYHPENKAAMDADKKVDIIPGLLPAEKKEALSEPVSEKKVVEFKKTRKMVRSASYNDFSFFANVEIKEPQLIPLKKYKKCTAPNCSCSEHVKKVEEKDNNNKVGVASHGF